eukprot:TRINITY_DN5424_c0_g1_i1.p1 TRINITY_DN5424_c0_g1~~TRINITY_DN5424_c0_g1_i1.p1  ORF type:complete len:380 (+),score=104.78 TRINITY_DN5424_c0_g1_i1:83-1222(+)
MGKGGHGGGGSRSHSSRSSSSRSSSHRSHHHHHHHHRHSTVMGTSTYASSGAPARCSKNQLVICLMSVLMFVGFMGPGLAMVIYPESTSFANAYESWLYSNNKDMTWYECVEVYQSSQSTAYALSSRPSVDPDSGVAFHFDFGIHNARDEYEYFVFSLLPGSVVNVTWSFTAPVSVYLLVDDDYDLWRDCSTCFAPIEVGAMGSYESYIQAEGEFYYVFDKYPFTSTSGTVWFEGTKTQYEKPEKPLKSFEGDGKYCVPWSDRNKKLYMLMEGPHTDPCDAACYSKEHKVRLEWSHRWYLVAPLMGGIMFCLVFLPLAIVFVMAFCKRFSVLSSSPTPDTYTTYSPMPTTGKSSTTATNVGAFSSLLETDETSDAYKPV